MNAILLLAVALLPRPDCPPVGAAEVELARVLEQGYAAGAVAPVLPSDPVEMVPGRFAVGFQPGAAGVARDWVAARGGRVVREDSGGGFLVVELSTDDPVGLAADAASEPALRFAEPDYRVRASRLPNDPRFLADQWDKWVMYADRAWDAGTGSHTVKLAVCDNGVEYWHADLAANFEPGRPGYDFVSGDDDPKPDDPSAPEAFHGTHVSGICAAALDNGVGVAGWSNALLCAVRVLDDSGSGNTSDLASGIRWAADNGCRVVNMSLGADAAPTTVIEACGYAAGRGVLLVAAAGNAGTSPVQYPAGLPECVCVGATDEFSGLASFSNYGSAQELVAPGTDILSTWVGGTWWFASGTSMACPEVAGVAALVLAADPGLGVARLRSILAASCLDKGLPGRDESFGHGLLNAARAVELAGLMARADREPGKEPPGAARTLARGVMALPGWCRQASAYSASGRLVARTGGRELALAPGTWFVRLEGAGRRELVKVVALR